MAESAAGPQAHRAVIAAMARQVRVVVSVDTGVPNIARVYDWLLGGKDNYPADREFGGKLVEYLPEAPLMARANREFLVRAVGYLAEAGIGQYLDLGSGLPTAQNVHQVAQAINPDARVVYVDHDPIVQVHGRALLADNANTAMVAADMRHPDQILADPQVTKRIDFAEPVAVLLVSVLHFLPDPRPQQIIDAFARVMAGGSYLVVSHAEDRDELADATGLYRDRLGTGHPRTRAQITALLEGFVPVDPGLVRLPDWRPDPHTTSRIHPGTRPPDLPFLGAVARRPTFMTAGARPAPEPSACEERHGRQQTQ